MKPEKKQELERLREYAKKCLINSAESPNDRINPSLFVTYLELSERLGYDVSEFYDQIETQSYLNLARLQLREIELKTKGKKQEAREVRRKAEKLENALEKTLGAREIYKTLKATLN